MVGYNNAGISGEFEKEITGRMTEWMSIGMNEESLYV